MGRSPSSIANQARLAVVHPCEEQVNISNITDISDRIIANQANSNGDRFVSKRELGEYYQQKGNPLSEEALDRAFATLSRQSESAQIRN